MKKSARKYIEQLGLMLFGLVIGVLLGEVVLRFIARHNQFYTFIPDVAVQDQFNTYDLFPGLDSTYFYSSNEFGYRSPSTFSQERLGILAIGGSTTECTLVGDQLNWTWLLEEKINAANPDRPVTIGNAGKSGLNASHHLLQVQHLPEQFGNIDKVMILVGINDYLRALSIPDAYIHYKDDPMVLRKTFTSYPPRYNEKWYQSTEIWMHLRDFNQTYLKKPDVPEDELRARFEYERKSWKEATLLQTLPDLSVALTDYKNKLSEIVELCQQKSLELILITQPVPWEKGGSRGNVAFGAYTALFTGELRYDFPALYEGMAQFNQVLKSFENEKGVRVIDLEAKLPKDITVFYDHCHFNRTGTPQVAQILFDELYPSIFVKP